MTETVAAFRRVLARGSSFPSLVETASGRLLVMKLSGAGQGSRGLATELIAGTLAGLAGLNVPRALPLLLPDGLPWQVGTDEFYETVQTERRAGTWASSSSRTLADLEAADLAVPAARVPEPARRRRRAAAERRSHHGQPERAARCGRHALGDRFRRLPADRPAGARRGRPRGSICPPTTSWPAARRSGCRRRSLSPASTKAQLDGALAELPEAWLGELGLSRQDLAGRLKEYFRSVLHT